MKFLVLLIFIVTVYSYRSRYCEICQNHTLCKYPVGGPVAACRKFEKEASLTDADITEIVNRINARRNLVAVGRLKKFPQAANMRKVQWSTELATFAQRWADQCDPSVKPNKEDECRDLVGMQVGQTIAAVVGPAPGLNVKSFVDMWFMLKLHYIGSIVYYNQSRDARTNYFTQLIWAENEYVGCGKIKFFNQDINTIVERLVCNFAPKGNNHGKPVYTLGFPATQCPKFMLPDTEFPGLCKQNDETGTEIGPDILESSLLRILGSSNNSVKQDLNILKQISYNGTEMKDQRNQKTRHAYINDSNGAIKRDSSHLQNLHLNSMNDIDNFKGHLFTQERGHSRMYHGHLTKMEPVHNYRTTKSSSEQDLRRFDIVTSPYPLPIQHNHDNAPEGHKLVNDQNDYTPDGRRIVNNHNDYVHDGHRSISDHNDYAQNGRQNFGDYVCTRKPKCNNYFPKPCEINQCTRGQSHSCNSCLKSQPLNSCLLPPIPVPPLPVPPLPLPPLPPAPLTHDLCSCKAKIPCLPIPSPVCPICPSHNCAPLVPTSCCDIRRSQSNIQDANKITQYNYYDLFPNIKLRSADENQRKHFNTFEIEDNVQNEAKSSILNEQVKESDVHLQMSLQPPQDLHNIFYSSKRKRRDPADQTTFKPFWQIDEFTYEKPSELKSLIYTTLADKRNKKPRWTTTTIKLPTESITIKLGDKLMHDNSNNEHVTGKYLSFEELMHLRKMGTLEALDYNIRRFGDQALRKKTHHSTTKKKTSVSKTSKKTKDTSKTKNKRKQSTTDKKSTKRITPKTEKKPTTLKKTNSKSERDKLSGNLQNNPKKDDDKTKDSKEGESNGNSALIQRRQNAVSKQTRCTRKVTCTWTALMIGSDGSTITKNQNIQFGAGRTDNCTRTSTCTRDFKDRNIMLEQTTENDSYYNDSANEPDDEEYCERRSLNVQRRNIVTSKILNIEFQGTLTRLMIPTTTEMSHFKNRGIVENAGVLQYKKSDCICYEVNSRSKRDISQYEQSMYKTFDDDIIKISTRSQGINNLHSMLRKMSFASKPNKIPLGCQCNGTKTVYFTVFHWVIIISYFFI